MDGLLIFTLGLDEHFQQLFELNFVTPLLLMQRVDLVVVDDGSLPLLRQDEIRSEVPLGLSLTVKAVLLNGKL